MESDHTKTEKEPPFGEYVPSPFLSEANNLLLAHLHGCVVDLALQEGVPLENLRPTGFPIPQLSQIDRKRAEQDG